MLKIAMVQINVTDMDRAIEWYRDTMGFEVSKEHYHHPVAVDLVHQGCRLLLHEAKTKAEIDYPHDAQTLICLETEDLRATVDKLKSRGVEFIQSEPQAFPGGLYIALRDPFGNVHELVEFQH